MTALELDQGGECIAVARWYALDFYFEALLLIFIQVIEDNLV